MNKNIAIVIPVHNEEKSIPILIDKILNLEERLTIMVVDDNSTDNSGEILDILASNHENIKVIHRKKQKGLHAVLINGLEEAINLNFDGVITMDGDLSHSPRVIPRILKYIDDYDLIVGSRFISGGRTINWNIKKKLMSAISRNMSRLFLGIKTKDCSSGLKYYDKRVLKYFNFKNFTTSGYAFQIETLFRAEKNSFKIKEIPIEFRGRIYGESKVNFKELKRYFKSFFLLLKKVIKNESET